ncbi:MAG: hypothetical protein ACRDNS_06960 [Trebonia sp.]
MRIGRSRGRQWLVAICVAGGVLGLAGPASAATVQATCSTFGSTLSSATSGETIALTGLCTGADASFGLPSGVSDLTIEGASSGVNGFNGTGASNSALWSDSAAAGLTLEDLTFESYSLTNGNAAVTLNLDGGALPVIENDRFINDADSYAYSVLGGGLEIWGSSSCSYTGTLQITGSTFSHDSITASGSYVAGGAGAFLDFLCAPPSTVAMSFSADTFSDNSINAGSGIGEGAGLYVANANVPTVSQLSVQQSGNVFEDNSITSSSPSSWYGGAGEWLGSVNLTSVDDEFIGNSLPGPAGGSAWSWGAGLYTVRGNCGTDTALASATATNLVAVGNTIGAPSAGGNAGGAGIYAGCVPTEGTGGFHLTLINSTVSGNSSPGGAAGVLGEIDDQLTLENSIVYGDSGPSELGGFGLSGGTGSISAANSDVCAVGSATSPFAGTGNICADPKLADVAGGDVHEAAASPTIDAGSNALVPAGVTSDFYDQPRVVGTNQSAGVIDIGAAEWQSAYVAPSPPSPPSPPSQPSPPGIATVPPSPAGIVGTATVSRVKATPDGVDVTVHCGGSPGQTCAGAVSVTTRETLQGSRVLALAASASRHRPKRHRRTVTVAHASYKLATGAVVTLKLHLNSRGRALLRRFKRLPATVVVTQTNAAGHTVAIATRRLTIKPQPKKRHHSAGR